MTSNVLLPTPENLIKTLEYDSLGRNHLLFRFIEMLASLGENMSLAVDGNWGCGKTFFIRQCQLLLDAYNSYTNRLGKEKIEKIQKVGCPQYIKDTMKMTAFVTAYYDAWEHDNDEDPLLSLVYEILQSVENDYSFSKNEEVLKCAASIAGAFVSKIDISQILENIPRKSDPFTALKNTKSLHTEISDFFNSLLPEKGNRLVIFVDELDRCKPSYAVNLLERIKHYFTDDRITFVFSINSAELSKTVRNYYGTDFNGCRYLDRFFDFRIPLTPVDSQKIISLLRIDEYSLLGITCKSVIEEFHLELREALRFKKTVDHTLHVMVKDTSGTPDGCKLFCLYMLIPIMIVLRMCDIDLYMAFVRGQNPEPLKRVFDNNKHNAQWLEFLLDHNESFSVTPIDGMRKVTMGEKLEEAYNALFVSKNILQNENKSHYVGSACFNRNTYNRFMETESMLSPYADYSL